MPELRREFEASGLEFGAEASNDRIAPHGFKGIVKNIQHTISRLKELHRELSRLGPIMRGSVVRLGPYKHPIFSLNKDKKTRLVYLGTDREQAAREYSANYKKMLEIAEEMTTLNMALLKNHYDPAKCLKHGK